MPVETVKKYGRNTWFVLIYVVAAITAVYAFDHFVDKDHAKSKFDFDAVIWADNVVLIVLFFIIGSVTAHTVWVRCRWRILAPETDPVDTVLAGMTVEAVGWIIHRGQWATWRFLRATEQWEAAKQIEDGKLLLSLVAFVVIMFGGMMVLSIWAKYRFGTHWIAHLVLLFSLVWIIAYELPTIVMGT